ncbi:pitrilysin family protein [Geothrix sp. 21YS21S-2]|uniref:M16 family metallopeptidase n=1 Tax=Geothrix sp. 21YS21S-2 TaxID=3068893 RepID=UPI0027BA37B1|nr:pitrilysin family protein [Geothrix sp. 21YS21S-2]
MARATILALLVSGALLAQAPPPRPEQLTFKPLAFEVPRAADFKAKLKNGIPVYVAADPAGVPFVRLRVFIRGGSFLEPRGKEGLASLTGMQMRAGGTAMTPAAALDERLEFLAGDIDSNIGDTSGAVAMEFMEKDLKEGLDLFMQVLTRPAFAQDRLDQAKENLLQGLQARNDKTDGIAKVELPRLLNGEDHFSSAQMTGASLKAITREDLAAFHARLLHPENLVVSVSGRFKKEAMLDLLNRTLGALKPGAAAQVSPRVPAPSFRRRPGIYVVDKDVPQSLVRFALPGLRRTDPDWHAAQVMNQILGGSGFTSRLMKKIRSDEGLTYGIGTGFSDGAHWKGNWSGSVQTKNRSVAYVLRLALAELERIKAQPVPPEELAVIKDSIVQAFPSQWGKKANVVNLFAQEQLTGWPENGWAGYREKIQAVTAEDVQRAARKYLDPAQLVILVVGKAGEAEAGDGKDHPGALKDVAPLPLTRLPLRDPLTLKPLS